MKKLYKIIVLLILTCGVSFAHAQGDAAARYEVDAKRVGVNPTDKDALPRSREFIRLDSTYYVGWMYEGIYKFDRSADYLGYKNAAIPLRKALALMEKDYKNTLMNMYSSIQFFAQNVNRYQDLFMITNALKECYDNLEMPDQVMDLLDKIDSYHFRKDYFGIYYHRAWTYHRNRFFTSDKFSFLKNSVEENEKMAFEWCYRGLAFSKANKAENDMWFGPMQAEQDRMAISHYLALLHCYNKNYDSSEYYYRQLEMGGAISWSNYGGMQSEVGNFENAINFFQKDQYKTYERMLREPYYYLPELFVYGGKTKNAIKMSQDIIQQSGSTPGFGWYNIALARGYLYDGQLDSCEYALDKAANFKEIHIGTTLTQSQYDFSINLLRVQLLDKRIDEVKFLNKGWWYSPRSLSKLLSYKLQKVMAEYTVVNELSYNPERNRVVYDLFCAESTTSFDEAWYMMKDFSPSFFQKKYEGYLSNDKRLNIQRYFYLFAARFKWQDGEYEKATSDFETLARSVLVDTANEKLFLGRLYESLAKAYDKKDNEQNFAFYKNSLYETYPQLLPFSGIKMQMHLSTAGDNDDNTKEVISDLKDCNIKWADNGSIPQAHLQFNKRGNKYEVIINVSAANGKQIVNNERIIFSKTKDVGKEIALRLFGKGGALEFDAS
ncbi:MAG: hypothetical protein J0I41_01665 [Filimonas sp.]|nr:hypothetical protein [Filimonas sp.]